MLGGAKDTGVDVECGAFEVECNVPETIEDVSWTVEDALVSFRTEEVDGTETSKVVS